MQSTHTFNNKKVIGITGAVIGAGVAIAAGTYLSKKENRKKVMHALTSMKKTVWDETMLSTGTKKLTANLKTPKKKKTKKLSPAKKATLTRPRDEKGHFTKPSNGVHHPTSSTFAA